ncbi:MULTISPECIES: carbohydrate kinase [unclassified Leifsonia]|uniref:carbohydrate kinase family protein n=1 Tax=unclassified Leifsonia TaxID=2663824 RepID=UPI0008A77A81|nr:MULTISPECIES: carbohydrate kinase [unclassified Leifsonia]SEH57103.1 fructokinase [Leifsonia sp. CL154]SFL21744.1 fructokinase [Leifsonia sp. CL147]
MLVAGEALTDVIRAGQNETEHPGGSPANVALGLARLDTATRFLTALGRDQRGARIASWLGAAGVEILPESWSLTQTSIAQATIGRDGAAEYAFDIDWRLPSPVRVPAVHHLHIGSISAFLDPGADQIEHLVQDMPAQATVSFDPNVRPDLIGDPEAARTRFHRLAARADIVKLSDEDAAYLYPGTAPDAVAVALAEQGGIGALTMGAAGSLLAAGNHLVHIEPIPTIVADTIGAGDSYMAAMLHQLLTAGHHPHAITPSQLREVGEFAARAAAITVSRSGAQPPTASELTAPTRGLYRVSDPGCRTGQGD